MVRNKKLIFIIIVILSGILLVGCDSDVKEKSLEKTEVNLDGSTDKDGSLQVDKPIRIGVTLASSEADYINTLEGYLIKYAKKENVKLIIQNASWDAKNQESHIDEFVALGVDAIILSPVNIKSMLIPLYNAYKKGVPVININMKVDAISTEYITTYVGSSSSEQAKLASSLFIESIGEEGGKIVIIEGSPGTDPQIYRTNAFVEQLLGYPQIDIVEITNGQWDREIAKTQALKLIKEYPDIRGIYCHDSNMAMGVIEAIESFDLTGNIIVVGISEGEEYENAIKDGRLHGLITQPAEYEAKTSINCAIAAANGESLRPWYKDPIEVVTSDNIDDYIKEGNE